MMRRFILKEDGVARCYFMICQIRNLLITGFQTTLEIVYVIYLPKTGLEPTQACTY